METVISLIPNDEHLVRTRQKLQVAGFAANKVDVLLQPADVWRRLDGRQKVRGVFKTVAIGAALGLVVGAIYSVPAGIVNCRLMNCTVETSVIVWAVVSVYWLIAGAFLGAIVGADRLEQGLSFYVDGVRRGKALFVVDAPEEKSLEAMHILEQEQGTIIHTVHEETKAK
jgi:hypothetical protein